ncbi:hypothetical protein N779_09480 [Vibrio coralliilyticus OCN008]|nr:hypothetical protein N779_09480 [Vibrio coralliilyticus OCN008]
MASLAWLANILGLITLMMKTLSYELEKTEQDAVFYF